MLFDYSHIDQFIEVLKRDLGCQNARYAGLSSAQSKAWELSRWREIENIKTNTIPKLKMIIGTLHELYPINDNKK